MKYLLPTGIGDSVWALHKVESVARSLGDPVIDIRLACGVADAVESRALDFVRRFPFIHSAEMAPGQGLLGDPLFKEGRWNYIEDGLYELDGNRYCVLVPNATLERGERIETWLPHHDINWGIFDEFRIDVSERSFASNLVDRIGPYAVFYPGPLGGNTVEGHNRNMIWRPSDWLSLGERVRRDFGLSIAVVGAPYDASYYDALLAPSLNGQLAHWTNLIGRTSIGQLYSVTSAAKFVVSYQAGVGIVSTYLGTPTAIFWRASGDSIIRDGYLSFDERMASAWTPPGALMTRSHLPLIYGRHGVDYIMDKAKERQWAS